LVPFNLHLSFDRLAGIVRDHLGGDPRVDTLVVFHNRRRTHLKLLWHDGRGYVILYKRIDHGRYRIPLAIPANARSVTVSRRELQILFEGIDARAVRRAVGLARARAR
jgi:transposase